MHLTIVFPPKTIITTIIAVCFNGEISFAAAYRLIVKLAL